MKRDCMGRAREGSTCPAGLREAIWGIICFAFLVYPIQVQAQSENAQLALEQPEAQLRVTGTLAKLDMSAGKGMLLTDLEKPIFFRLDRPELFERISIGDRVTMQLDEDGRVIKVIEALPAELHEPPPPAK